MQNDFDEPNFAEPGESENYNPDEDDVWYDENVEYRKKKRGTNPYLISVFIAVIVYFLVSGIIWIPLGTGLPDNYEWTEAKTVVGILKSSLDTLATKNDGDLSDLDEPNGNLKEGFTLYTNLYEKLMIEPGAFENLHYFDADDFSIEFVNDGKDGYYIITVNSKKGGGLTGTGPAGSGSYNSQTNEWTGDLE